MLSKILVQARSTEKPLKGLKSTSKGESLEKYNSIIIHKSGTPLLVSSLILREFNCGQVDISIFYKNQIHIFEVKCKPEAITKKQRARLMQSLEFIASVFECSGQVHVIKKLPNDAPFLNLNI